MDLIKQIQHPDYFKNTGILSNREHAKNIDQFLGIKVNDIEIELYNRLKEDQIEDDLLGSQTWIGLNPQVLQTPYHEIYEFFELMKKWSPTTIVDLGAGYGRVGFVMNAFFPEGKFIGYEFVPERCKEARRVFKEYQLNNCEMHAKNILDTDFELPEADLYFIYDFSNPLDLKDMLQTISKKMYKDRFFLVAKGEGIRSLIQLKFPEFWAAHGVIHSKEWSLYSSFCDLE